ncbi:MAG: hypothetical protein ACFWT0_06295 [Bifidobacterium crudilactis]
MTAFFNMLDIPLLGGTRDSDEFRVVHGMPVWATPVLNHRRTAAGTGASSGNVRHACTYPYSEV